MSARQLTGVILTLAFAAGVIFAWRHAYAGGTELLFDTLWWLVVFAPLAGITLAGATYRKDPVIEGDRVLRHDSAAMLEHWTHGIGTAVLLISGISLGLLFVPSLLASDTAANAMMNVHFVAVILFLFGTFYYLGNTALSGYRFKEHLPTKNAIPYTVRHYGLLLGSKKHTMPPEAKYFESEKMAYIMALVATGLVIITGFLKAAAHVVDLPEGLMGAATLTHDIATVVMLLFFLAHVFFAAIAPGSAPMLKSMLTGYVPLEHAKKEHAGWLEQLTCGQECEADAPASPETLKG